MTDAALVRRVLDGDVGAYTTLVDRHYDRCARYAYRMLGDREDAEDVLQETFLRAYRGLGYYQDRDAFAAWLFRILINQCRTAATRRGRRERLFVHDEHALREAPARGAVAETPVGEEVQSAIGELDSLLREAFLLKHVEELSYEEMAELTGASISALKMRVKRACDWLRVRLEEVYHE
jgi:RNA polymerase sigma-70 factor (ECF subfamily)